MTLLLVSNRLPVTLNRVGDRLHVRANPRGVAAGHAPFSPGHRPARVRQMTRERVPDAGIGFFLHIPFPPYDVFRLLPWHRELLRGVLGADLVGFHTYDYMRTFVGSVRRGLGYESRIGTITAEHRVVQADVFPLGIDVETFASAPVGPAAGSSIARPRKALGASKLVSSISRLDYTKGIPEQLEAL